MSVHLISHNLCVINMSYNVVIIKGSETIPITSQPAIMIMHRLISNIYSLEVFGTIHMDYFPMLLVFWVIADYTFTSVLTTFVNSTVLSQIFRYQFLVPFL